MSFLTEVTLRLVKYSSVQKNDKTIEPPLFVFIKHSAFRGYFSRYALSLLWKIIKCDYFVPERSRSIDRSYYGFVYVNFTCP